MPFRAMTDEERLATMEALIQCRPGGIITVPNGVDPRDVMDIAASMRNPYQYEFSFMNLSVLRRFDHIVLSRPKAIQHKQTRRGSAIEQITNIIVGLGVQLGALWYFHDEAMRMTIGYVELGVIMTVLSYARGWLLRRLFEHLRVTGRCP